MRRIVIDGIVLVALFLLPWWVSVSLIGILMFVFLRWYEGIVFAFLIDALSAGGGAFGGFGFMATSIAALACAAAPIVRKRLAVPQ